MLQKIPHLIAGPFLRHTSINEICVMLVTSIAGDVSLRLEQAGKTIRYSKTQSVTETYPLGKKAFLHLLVIHKNNLFDPDIPFSYDVLLDKVSVLSNPSPTGCKVPTKLQRVMHGSCRKLHGTGGDALVQASSLLATEEQPDILFLTGDQVYIDDVAGPTLHAINQIIELLGLHQEAFSDAVISHSTELAGHVYGYYQREALLPDTDANEALEKAFFTAKKKPIFTSVNAQNHLMSFAEVCALYLLSFSPVLWEYVEFDENAVESKFAAQYRAEQKIVEAFVGGLHEVQRVLSHVPTYMIFDDHDVTDDWNLNRTWENAVYQNPFSKRIIGNALLGYFLFQGLGNQPLASEPLRKAVQSHFLKTKIKHHDALLDTLYAWQNWHYQLATEPPVRVLDTRTQRWRSESNPNKPSGLMDWEALVELQQSLLGHNNVIVVSAAPIYGMKFIEMIQRVFTWLGQALTVDAENWMAHKGTANVILNIFRHVKTPPRFIILSGDVHYSFVYDVRMRFQKNSPQVMQFTCSGIKNQFPDKLLKLFDRLNRIFYSSRSPLNFLTKRRHMKITEREPMGLSPAEHINPCAVGILHLPDDPEADLQHVKCQLLTAEGKRIDFSTV